MENYFKQMTESYRLLKKMLKTVNKLDSALGQVLMSPVERHILWSYAFNNDGLFHHNYDDWKVKRINKLLDIYDIDWFKGKRILELGCGHGDIGAFLATLGSEVVALDGRLKNVNFAKLKHKNVENFHCIKFNLEHNFTEFGRFDLLINFGLLYHLKNVDKHLENCFKTSDDILFETVVCDSVDPQKIFFCEENNYVNEESLEGIGSRPSPFYIERFAKENNFEVVRYFDSDLNSGNQFLYNWEHKNDERQGDDFKLRRFWRFVKRKQKGEANRIINLADRVKNVMQVYL